jgi:hypothetical protein
MRIVERPFSDLLRHPKQVTEDLEDSDVLLRRRDEPDLRLSLADRDAGRASALVALGHTLRNVAVHNPGALASALTEAFPWLEFLPPGDRKLFVDEFSRVTAASAELDNYAALSQLLSEWRATAEVHADPKLARRSKRPLQADGEPVTPPTG